ncbi:MAG TPA: phosphoglycerate dehydrogenase [Candidatus Merdenecus merdavium]|nr:phosphoglycerate dehydrogenase [Candidatus Merdenecus merdavium]
MFKYNCLNPIADIGLELFSDEYEFTENFEDSEAVLVRSANLHQKPLHDGLVAIARAGAGVNNIPLEECADKGIVVFNTPGANSNGVKELVLAGMLLASRDIVGGINWVTSEKDNENIAKLTEKEKSRFSGTELKGKKLGVIGLGAIGVKVSNAATHLGMTVYGYDPYISVDAAWSLSRGIKHIQNIDDIYTECDFITVHVPLLDSTKEMINKNTIALMKDHVVILNFARDLLVHEEDMVAALKEGKVKKYVTDFPNPTIAGEKGVIAIPHLGASTQESEDNCAVMAVKELREFMENGNIKNSVNYPNCDLGVCTQASRVAINHRNIKNMIGQFASVIGSYDINISDMVNKSKGNYAYTLLDLEEKMTSEVVDKLMAIDGVLKVRIVK